MFPRLHTQNLLALYIIWIIEAFWNSSVAIRKTESCTLIPLIGKDRFPQIPLLLRVGGDFKEFLTTTTEIGSPDLCADKCLEA